VWVCVCVCVCVCMYVGVYVWVWLWVLCVCVCMYVGVCVCMFVCGYVWCVCVGVFLLIYYSMPHYMVILHALLYLIISFTLNILLNVTEKSGNLRNHLRKDILQAVSNLRKEFASLNTNISEKPTTCICCHPYHASVSTYQQKLQPCQLQCEKI